MNLALTDPFILAQDYPEALTGKLSGLTAPDGMRSYADSHKKDLAMRLVSDSTAEVTFLLQAECVLTSVLLRY